MSNTAISVQNLSKRYRIGLKEELPDTLTGALTSWVKSPVRNFKTLRRLSRFTEGDDAEDIIWALRDVSFEIKHGEVVGIIGRNGAGKSTLLKILAGITEPTSGHADIYGRVASLLEVGTGFHQELTGRENIYLNGTILGMTKAEIDRKFDEIVDFSGVEKFIDTPVKRYSSGMQVRLAFSVAAHLEPEILLIDEVLAVGDVAFQKKCLGKMNEVAQGGRTVLFISHDMAAINSLCPRVIYLANGFLTKDGEASEVTEYYFQDTEGSYSRYSWSGSYRGDRGDAEITLKEITLKDSKGLSKGIFHESEPITIHIKYEVHTLLRGSQVKIHILGGRGSIILTSTDIFANIKQYHDVGTYESICTIPGGILNQGNYSIVVFSYIPFIKFILPKRDYVNFSIVQTTAIPFSEHIKGVLNPYLASWELCKIS